MVENSAKPDWDKYQDIVAEMLNLIPGCVASPNQLIYGSRIGGVHVDVLAEFTDPRNVGLGSPRKFGDSRGGHGFAFRVIVECKFWSRRIPQEKVFALKTIVEDVGASLGILISEYGVQKGAAEYLDQPINILAMTFEEFKDHISHGMHLGDCSQCEAKILCPFRPSGERPIYCRTCFGELRGDGPVDPIAAPEQN